MARKKPKRTPTLEERARAVADQSQYQDRLYKRALRELRAAVRAERKAFREDILDVLERAAVMDQAVMVTRLANVCADRIARRET